MTLQVVGADLDAQRPLSEPARSLSDRARAFAWASARSIGFSLVGLAGLFAFWWIGAMLVASNPNTAAFADFAPGPTLDRLSKMLASGEVLAMTVPSLWRIGLGLTWATAIGVPIGLIIGRQPIVRAITNMPFQFLR
ncbi:MAG: ABC transporter permease, partial [Hyphomicrobiaceae bacterium]